MSGHRQSGCGARCGSEPGDRIVAAMSAALPAPDVPAVSVAGAIARMEEIAAALPAADGLACFNRMYLDVTRQVNSQLGQGFFADPAFMTSWTWRLRTCTSPRRIPPALPGRCRWRGGRWWPGAQ